MKCRHIACALLVLSGASYSAAAQTVRVDTTPARVLKFDPDLALGSSMDILPADLTDVVYSEPLVKEALSAGWGPITYRQNTELTVAAWHWNSNGTWSDVAHQSGYFTGSAEPKEFIRHSFGYPLPHRGNTRGDGSAGRMINLEWVKHGAGVHQLAPADVDLRDDAGHVLITAYPAKRPDGQWSLMLINKDPSNAHEVKIEFAEGGTSAAKYFADPLSIVTFGAEQYVW